MNLNLKKITLFLSIAAIFLLTSYKQIEKRTDTTSGSEIINLNHASSTAIGYCASLASMAFNTEVLPVNVVFYEEKPGRYCSSGIIHAKISEIHPLPFIEEYGDIEIAAVWDNYTKSGVMNILFKKIDILSQDNKFTLIETIPFIEDQETGKIITVFDNEDILQNKRYNKIKKFDLSVLAFSSELERVTKVLSGRSKPNTCFVKIDQQNTFPNILDDDFEINSTKQIAIIPNAS